MRGVRKRKKLNSAQLFTFTHESKNFRQTIKVALGGGKMSVMTLCTTEVDQIRISFIVFAMSSHAFRAFLLSRRSKFSAHNLINVFSSSFVHLAYTRLSSTEEDDELDPMSST